jgi:acyl-coenzyme A thioesterase PaaI-like protein
MPYSNSIPWISCDPDPDPNRGREPAGAQDGPGGLDLQIAWDGTEAVLALVVPDAIQGAPRIAHGGFLATLADHVMGFAAAQQDGRSAVTRQLTVDYLAPTPTSERLTIRARADAVTERTVTVSLDGSLDSGLVTFRARGDYARVAPRRQAGRTPADYDNLEERFDPAQIFSWLADALKTAYRPAALRSPIVLALDVPDARPREWTVRATAESLTIEPGEPGDWDVRFAGTVKSWRQLVYRRKTVEQTLAAGLAAIDDPRGLLPAFLAALDT